MKLQSLCAENLYLCPAAGLQISTLRLPKIRPGCVQLIQKMTSG